jgi:hypothetical protein
MSGRGDTQLDGQAMIAGQALGEIKQVFEETQDFFGF